MLVLLTIGMLSLTFNIQPAKSEWTGTVYIRADGSIDPPDAPIETYDNMTYTLTDNITSSGDGIVVQRDNIVVNGAGYTLQELGDGGAGWKRGILLSGVSNVTLKNMRVKAFDFGILLTGHSSNNTVSRNNIRANRYDGIRLYFSSNNTITGNNITDNEKGVCLEYSNSNVIFNNNVTANTFGGITLYYSSNNNVTRNDLKTIWNEHCVSYAVDIEDSSNNTISNNNMENNWDGVHLSGSSNNVIVGNTIKANNPCGVYFYQSSNNTFFHNNFIDNRRQVGFDVPGPGYPNIWDNGSEGNYWDDYTGVDANGDGIGDTPYIINEKNRDNYPLITPWSLAAPSDHPSPTPPEVQVGVKAGDWIKVEYTISGWPSGQPYPEWLKIEFLTVEGINITVRVTMHMSDGTKQNATVPVIVGAGGGEAFGLSGFVIPANLTIGDSVYISGYGNVTLAGETTRTYAGASRTVVYASFSQYGTQLTYYWDKQTGVMVEASTTSGSVTATAKATETNMWQPAPSGFPIEPIYIIAIAIIIIIIVAAVLLIRKRKT